jgi:predicted ATPase
MEKRSHAKLKTLSIKGFKTIDNVDSLEFKDLNVLIGPNGSGKSNLISFFRMLSQMVTSPGQLQRFVETGGRANSFLHNGSNATREIECQIDVEAQQGLNSYRFRLAYAANDTLLFVEEACRFVKNGTKPGKWEILADGQRESAMSTSGELKPVPAAIRSMMRRFVAFQFHNTSEFSRMKKYWPKHDNKYLKEDGGNIAPILYRLQEKYPKNYLIITDILRQILPFFIDFELAPDESDNLYLSWREKDSDCIFGAHQASDGMLRAISLVTLLCMPNDETNNMLPSLIVLDEPELGLHPSAVDIIAGLIKSLSRKRQVIIATQSPQFLDCFDVDNIIVTERKDKSSTYSRLSEEKLKSWLEDYSLSALWYSNLFGGKP